MAPIKPKPGSKKKDSKKIINPGDLSSKVKKRKHKAKADPTKTKAINNLPKKKKKRVYTAAELGIPELNKITSVGVQKSRGKKKGKIFVDDQESMMTILAMVNAEKEGQIESKMMRARQMEEIREARQKEAEARQQEKRSKLEETKDSLRRRKREKQKLNKAISSNDGGAKIPDEKSTTTKKKRVSFG